MTGPIEERGPALSAGAACYRTIGPFARDTIPQGLLREHRLKPGAWAILYVDAGTIRFVWDDEAGGSRTLQAADSLLVPPQVPHHLEPGGPVSLRIEFWAPPAEVS